MQKVTLAGALQLLTLFAALAVPSSAQCETFGPLQPGFRVSQGFFYDQVWSHATRVPSGFLFAWSAGQDILLRRFDAALNPLGDDTLVNTTLNLEQQDEPAICTATGGNVLVAWSERYGYDGEQMGIYGRLYSSAGAPLGAEFRINQQWQASQWRPLIEPTPAGGFVVTWTGDWDGNSYFRVLSSSGAFLTGDVRINQYENDAQVDPAIAVAPNGTIFAAFVDFSSHGGVGSGLNLYGRLFNASGAALGNEFTIPATLVDGDQRSPRVAVDGQSRFVVTWNSELSDGDGYGIVCRRYSVAGAPLGPEFVVNGATTSDQVEPVVAAEADGDFLIAWNDYSNGDWRVFARRFDANAQPKGADFAIADTSNAYLPSLSFDATGGDLVVTYDVWNGSDWDVYARRFAISSTPQVYCTAKVNTQGCTPQIGSTGAPSASLAAPFTITAANVLNQRFGVLVYGFQSAFTPFQGGTLCLVGPRRTATQFSNGTTGPSNCTGTFTYDFNARIQSGVDAQLFVGQTVSAQYYYRDPAASFGAGLTDALRFTICP